MDLINLRLTRVLVYFVFCLIQLYECLKPPQSISSIPSVPSVSNLNLRAGSYYSGINTNLNGTLFKKQLADLISVHTELTYDQLWTAFKTLDQTSRCNQPNIGDIYSNKCWTPGNQQCGNYKKEGDCYNREHSWPKSWWGGESAGYASYTDLFHLFPTDGYDNGRRGDFPLGSVSPSSITYRTSNGCLLGQCDDMIGYTGTCWEVADYYKGAIARAYFYISTAYMNIFKCCTNNAVINADMKPWLLNLLLDWHHRFPVSDEEIRRNDLIFQLYQGNRNPFIDYPEWVDKILQISS